MKPVPLINNYEFTFNQYEFSLIDKRIFRNFYMKFDPNESNQFELTCNDSFPDTFLFY